MRLGIWQPNAPSDFSNLYALESAIGRQVDIIPWYQAWTGANSAWNSTAIQTVHARDDIPMITWEPWNTSGGTTQPTYTMASITAGNHDTYIESWASAAAQESGVILIRLMHEMNGDWYPWCVGENGTTSTNYKVAFQYVVQKFRDAGADNVQFVWCPNRQDTGSGLSDLYPGDTYVDWMGIDGYNWGTSQPGQSWRSFATTFGATYTALTGFSDRKIIICETASSSVGGNQATWISDALDLSTLAGTYPEIDGIIWFNEDANSDWTFSDSPASVTAFANEVSSWGAAPLLYVVSSSVENQADDGYTFGGSTLDTTAVRFSVGSKAGAGNYNAFNRFVLNVPPEATVVEARVDLFSFADASALGGTAQIYAFTGTNEASPTSFAEMLAGPFTTASVEWAVPATTSDGVPASTPDIASVIQELKDQSGWTSGNHIVIAYLRDDAADGYGRFAAHEHATLPPPKLVVAYTLPEPGTGYYLSFTPSDTNSTDTDELSWEIRTASGGGGTLLASGTATSGITVDTGWVEDLDLVDGNNTRYLWLIDGAGNTLDQSFTVTANLIIEVQFSPSIAATAAADATLTSQAQFSPTIAATTNVDVAIGFAIYFSSSIAATTTTDVLASVATAFSPSIDAGTTTDVMLTGGIAFSPQIATTSDVDAVLTSNVSITPNISVETNVDAHVSAPVLFTSTIAADVVVDVNVSLPFNFPTNIEVLNAGATGAQVINLTNPYIEMVASSTPDVEIVNITAPSVEFVATGTPDADIIEGDES